MIKDNLGRHKIELSYSGDYLNDEERSKKFEKLYHGGDLVTKVLCHFNIPFNLNLVDDFYHDEPLLKKVVKYDKHGIEFTLYTYWFALEKIEGRRVLCFLESLGVIPCSFEESLRIGGEK